MSARKTHVTSAGKANATDTWLGIYFLLPAIEAAVSIGIVFSAPSEGGSTLFLGLSAGRWVLVAGLVGILLLFSFIVWTRNKNKPTWLWIKKRTTSLVEQRYLYLAVMIVAAVIAVLAYYFILLTFKFTDQFIQARLQRVFPLSLWIFLFCLQTVVILPRLKAFANRDTRKVPIIALWGPYLLAFGSLVLVSLVVSATRLGLQPDRVGWDNPGVPLLGTQVAFAWFLGVLICGLLWFFERRFGWRASRIDLVAGLFFWLFAIWIWQSQPLTPTFFSPSPRLPNYEFYPYSDAATHDLGSQNLLIGNGFPDVLEKPLYSLFLAILHLFVGQDYQDVVNAQIVVLALFPVVLFLLGSKFHQRISGGMLAFAIIFREANAIALSGDIRVSHSKLLMTDLPAALGIAALSLLLLRWLQSEKEDYRWLIGVGGALGLLTLLRSQTIVFLPGLLILAFLRGGPILRQRFVQAGIVFFGLILAISPWLFRNYLVTGQLGYSQPLQAAYLARQYSLTPELAETGFPVGTAVSDYTSLGFAKAVQFTVNHPGEVAGFVSAHFFHNEVSLILALPTRFDFAEKLVTFYNLRPYWTGLETRLWTECCSLDAYVTGTPYWQNWDGIFPADAWLPIIINLGLISVGIGAAWRKVGWLTLVPIGIHVFYNISAAIARVSGWRLVLPVDWVLLMFYCLGVGQISWWAWEYLEGPRLVTASKNILQKQKSVYGWQTWQLISLGAIILFAGLLLPLSEIAVPERFATPTAEMAQNVWEDSVLSAVAELQIDDFLSQPNAEILVGRAMYPRFYPVDAGEPGGQWSAFNPLPFSRMALSLVGPKSNQVALPLETAPAEFPNATDVLVIGCDEDTYFRAAAIIFMDHSTRDLLAGNVEPFACVQ